MKMKFLCAGMLAFAALMMAQKPKSQKEVDAINAVIQAKTPDDKMAAVDSFVQKFADTEFKTWALNYAATSAQQKKDSPKAIFYAEQAVAADKNDAEAMILIATELAMHTREFDLDKDDKLAKADKSAKDALAILPGLAKPGYMSVLMQVTDPQWEGAKKDMIAQAHVALGMSAMVKKKSDVAIDEFKAATDATGGTDATTMIRLAGAYNEAGKPDQAMATVNKINAMPNLNPAYKPFIDTEKTRAEKALAAKK
jgi:hypothetical protein